jgi:hypothetical protein
MGQLMSDPQLRQRMGSDASDVRSRYCQDAIMKHWERCLFPESQIVGS